MSKRPTRPQEARPGISLIALSGLLLLALLLPSTAAAATASGEVKIVTQPRKAKTDLLSQGVEISTRPSGKGLELSVDEIRFGKASTTVGTKGSLVFKRGKRKAALRDVRLVAHKKGTSLTGKLGKAKLTVFQAGKAQAIANSVALRNGNLSLTRKGANALADKLGLDSVKPGRLGKLTFNALQDDLIKPEEPKKEEPAKPVTPDGKEAYPYAAQCPVSAVSGPKFGHPPTVVAGTQPLPSFEAGTSQPVTGTSIEWGFLASFRNYVGNAPKGFMRGLDGVSTNPSEALMALPSSYFGFPVGSGSYEAGSEPDHSADKLVANSTGTALFCKSGHGFSYAFRNVTVVIDGADSRIVADIGVNQHGEWYPFQRVDLASLELETIEPDITDDGNTITWEEVPVKLTADGEKAIGGIYSAGETLDKVSVETVVNRPMLAACDIDAGTMLEPETVDFSLAPQPGLASPVTGSVGTINWGFRGIMRSQVAPRGGFRLFGGATEGYPGNMGGNSTDNPPDGRKFKFFRFPISGFSYEENTASATDDQLIATSEATVGFCNTEHRYGFIISKPTLVIDEAQSRLTANVYSFAEGDGWVGGRVDLVDLDASGVGAVNDAGTISWGQIPEDNNPLETGIPVIGGLTTEALKNAAMGEGSGTGGFDPVAAQIVLPSP